MSGSHYYTMIGSRTISDKERRALVSLAAVLWSQRRMIGRSGGADGADKCLEFALIEKISKSEKCSEIYLPWNGFKGRYQDNINYFLIDHPDSKLLFEQHHPNPLACNHTSVAFHRRNTHQILGKDLKTPSEFCICVSNRRDSETGHVEGGTGTAVSIAISHNIPVFNLRYKDGRQALLSYLVNEDYGSNIHSYIKEILSL